MDQDFVVQIIALFVWLCSCLRCCGCVEPKLRDEEVPNCRITTVSRARGSGRDRGHWAVCTGQLPSVLQCSATVLGNLRLAVESEW